MIRAKWVTRKQWPVDVEMKRNKRLMTRRRGGGAVPVKSIYHADVMVASSNWPVARALKLHLYTEAKERGALAARILRGSRDTGNSKIVVKRGVVDSSVFLEDPLNVDANGRQIGGAAFAVEGQTQALGRAFGTQFVRRLNGWKEMFGDEPPFQR